MSVFISDSVQYIRVLRPELSRKKSCAVDSRNYLAALWIYNYNKVCRIYISPDLTVNPLQFIELADRPSI